MDTSRRSFVQAIGGVLGAAAIASDAETASLDQIKEATQKLGVRSAEQVAEDESFWSVVRQAYDCPKKPISFMSGWYGLLPRIVRTTVAENWERTNDPQYHLWAHGEYWHEQIDLAYQRLASHVNCSAEELALTRNTTEAINTVVFGLDLKPGDELITSQRDYGLFRGAMLQRAARDGIRVRVVDLPVPVANGEELVQTFVDAIGPATRAILACHVYSTGQLTPVRQLCDAAHARGVQVIIDGALAFGHVAVDLKSLHCDYYGASFHKFAGGPRGTGFLFVKKERIGPLWPSYGSLNAKEESNHRSEKTWKLVAHGTDTTFLHASVPAMLDFQEAIGVERRVARFQYLKRYLADGLAKLGCQWMAPLDPESSCGLLGCAINGLPARDVTLTLLEEGEFLVPHPDPEFNWINFNPATSTEDIDRLVTRLAEFPLRAGRTNPRTSG